MLHRTREPPRDASDNKTIRLALGLRLANNAAAQLVNQAQIWEAAP
jgi:hypothetical protein